MLSLDLECLLLCAVLLSNEEVLCLGEQDNPSKKERVIRINYRQSFCEPDEVNAHKLCREYQQDMAYQYLADDDTLSYIRQGKIGMQAI